MESKRWKLTEVKYLKLKKLVILISCFLLIYYASIISYAVRKNPGDFIWNYRGPMPEEVTLEEYNSYPIIHHEPAAAKLHTLLVRVIIIAWILVIVAYIYEVKTDKKHWLRTAFKKLDEIANEEEEKKSK